MTNNKIPWWIKKGVPNPMKNPETKKKVSISVKKTFKERNIAALISKKNKGRKGRSISKEEKKKASERMKKNNPMKNPEIVKKVVLALKKLNSKKDYIHPNTGNKRPDAKTRMLSKDNPMKDPKIAKKVWNKANETIHKNGNLSEGQSKLYKLLDALKIKYKKEKFFRIGHPNLSYAFADVYLPKEKIIIEYDGFHGHFTESGKKYDLRRDRNLIFMYGVSILRLSTNTIFAKDFIKTLKRTINEIKMEKNPIRKKIGHY